MVFGVGHVELVAGERHSLRMVKRGRRERPVLFADGAAAGNVEQLAVQGRDDDAVVVAVGDEQAAARLIGQHLAGKFQRRGRQLVPLEPQRQRRPIERSVPLVIGDELGDVRVARGSVPLARNGLHELSLGIDECQRGPDVNAAPRPDSQIGIVEDRVLDLVTDDGPANVFGFFFVGELGRTERRIELTHRHPDGILVSAVDDGEGLPELSKRIETEFRRTLSEVELLLPYDEGGRLAELHALAGDLQREDTPEGVRLFARLPPSVAARYAPYALSHKPA